jgi:hypothetical protein
MQAKGIWKQDPEANIWAKRDDNGECRRFHKEELNISYRSPNIVRLIKSKRIRWAGHAARMEEGRSALRSKPTEKRPLGRPQRRWEDNTSITMDLKEIGINSRNCVDSAQDTYYWRAHVNETLNLRIP